MSRFRRNGSGTQEAPAKEKGEKPIWSRRYWTGSGHLEVAVWSRMIGEGKEEREVLNTTLKKSYKDGDDYKESKSYRPEELGLVAFAMQEAFAFISSEMERK